MGRPRTHDERTERELLRAAETLLAEEGAEALSVRRLADAAGTSARAIYSVFGSKDGLVRAVFRDGLRALSEELDALPLTDDPAGDLVTAGVEGFRRWALAHPELFRLVFEGHGMDIEPDPADAEAGRAALERLVLRVRRCAEAGIIAPEAVTPMTLAMHALCEGLTAVELRRRLPMAYKDPETVWRQSLQALVAGFAR